MQCPHCRVAFHDDWVKGIILGDESGETTLKDSQGLWRTKAQVCPSCDKAIVLFEVVRREEVSRGSYRLVAVDSWMAYPKGTSRPPVPTEVPKEFANDYKEACLVFADSPKASAALSRRCLQNLLRQVAKVKWSDLANEIQQVLDAKQLPTPVAQALDAIRNIGNFAAHPMKSEVSGEIMDVEPGEAEWTLEALEMLFDHYFVQPKIFERKRDALNAKLKEARKPPMKQ